MEPSGEAQQNQGVIWELDQRLKDFVNVEEVARLLDNAQLPVIETVRAGHPFEENHLSSLLLLTRSCQATRSLRQDLRFSEPGSLNRLGLVSREHDIVLDYNLST